MSNPLLVAVANATPYTATLTSTNGNGGDNITIAPYTTGFTGGSDADYIQIPECSAPKWYAGHHILVDGRDVNGASQWQVALWANDEHNAVLYWNNTDGYSDSNPLPGTGGGRVMSTLYIGQNPNGALFVNATGRPT